jgi:hypothetical protein
MRRARHCGLRCHNAKRPKCNCWCGGRFHGEQGRQAREAFVEQFGDVPRRQPADADALAAALGVNRAGQPGEVA